MWTFKSAWEWSWIARWLDYDQKKSEEPIATNEKTVFEPAYPNLKKSNDSEYVHWYWMWKTKAIRETDIINTLEDSNESNKSN